MNLGGFDIFDQYESLNMTLCNPDFNELYAIGVAFDRKLTLRFNSVHELSFNVPEFVQDGDVEISLDYYPLLAFRRLIYVEYLGWFIVGKVSKVGDGIKEMKEVTAYSYQADLMNKKVSLFKGTYKFYDLFSPSDTLMGRILSYLPNWSIGSVDAELITKYRTFDVSDKTLYDFVLNDVEAKYDCIFKFDIISRQISAYTVANATTNTDIYMSYDNLINEIKIDELPDELVTALNVYGGGNLSISTVNPLGTDTIYNLNYFKTTEWMDQNLIDAITDWEDLVEANQETYADLLTQLKNEYILYYEQLADKVTLQGELAEFEGLRNVRIQQGLSLSSITSQINAKNVEIVAKQSEIDSTQINIENISSQLYEINSSLSFDANFTEIQQSQLSNFIVGQTYQNDAFVQTDVMTNDEIQDMAQELYDQGQTILGRISQQRYTFDVDGTNFVFLKEFEAFTNQLEMGCVLNVKINESQISYPILLELSLNYDSPTDFKMTFGNRLRLDNGAFTLGDLVGDAFDSGQSTKFNGELWNDWSDNYQGPVSTFITSALDASKNAVINAANQDIVLDQNGLTARQFFPDDNNYGPKQVKLINNLLVFTKDNWETASIALGELSTSSGSVYGLVADTLVGRILAGNELTISNENNTFLVNGSGATLVDASLSLTKSDGNAKIVLDPNTGIQISKRNSSGNYTPVFYVDDYGNLVFSGNLSGASGTFSGTLNARIGNIGAWTINEYGLKDNFGNYIYGNGNVRLGALTITGSNAWFNGNIYANNLQGLIQANQIGTINADTINAGSIRGIDIIGTHLYWPGVEMYSPLNGVSIIEAYEKLLFTSNGNKNIMSMSPYGIQIFSREKIRLLAGGPTSPIEMIGALFINNKEGVSGTFTVGPNSPDRTLNFTNGILTGLTYGISGSGLSGINYATNMIWTPSSEVEGGGSYDGDGNLSVIEYSGADNTDKEFIFAINLPGNLPLGTIWIDLEYSSGSSSFFYPEGAGTGYIIVCRHTTSSQYTYNSETLYGSCQTPLNIQSDGVHGNILRQPGEPLGSRGDYGLGSNWTPPLSGTTRWFVIMLRSYANSNCEIILHSVYWKPYSGGANTVLWSRGS